MAARQEYPAETPEESVARPLCPAHLVQAATAAHRALLDLTQAAALESSGREADLPSAAGYALRWHPGLPPAELAEEAFRYFSELSSATRVFTGGRAYCYACGGSDCEHAIPAIPGEVFTGYESTGRPRWQEFFSFLLELGDERTDRLFDDQPELLARVIGRTRLVAAQLRSFGRNSFTYRVWGQVVAGYLQVRGTRAALSTQIVEDKRHQLHLQVISAPLLREALADAPEDRRSAFARVYDALEEARRQTASLSDLWQHANRREQDEGTHEKAFTILRHLAHSLEQKGRQQWRRTNHAEIRAGQNRPVHKAFDDVVAATMQDVYTDRFKQSVIVLGRSGRAHAFSRDGRHITSLMLAGDELERRVSRGRYVQYGAADVETFRASVLAALPTTKPE
jgi:hypothetical protein